MSTLSNFIYSYTCIYYFVSTPNPPAAKSLTNFLLFREKFLFFLRGREAAFIVSCLLFFLLFVRLLVYILHYYQLLFFLMSFNIKKIFDDTNSKQLI